MATFDQLPAEQRAILELVLQRRQSYEDLADMLGMPAARVRELAQEALVDLAPHSAGRVDADWRGQVADYLLGQQTGPEGTATRGHLKRSEPARLWALSLLDSLDHLYAGGDLPVIPEGEAAPARSRSRERPARSAGPLAGAKRERAPRPARAALSPDAEALVRRRRVAAAAAGAALLLIALFVWPIGLLTGDDDDGGGGDNGSEQADGEPQILGQLLLRPQEGERGVGVALVRREPNGDVLLQVEARGLKRTRRGQAYEVWLYNDQGDAQSLGAQLTDRQGNYRGAGRLPENYEEFRFLDMSREPVDQNAEHSGESVLRGAFEDLQPAGQTSSGEGTATTPEGTPTTPEG